VHNLATPQIFRLRLFFIFNPMAKYTLDKPDDFNFLLYGIVCPENQYVLVNAINASLHIDLCLEEYIDLSHRIGKDFKFSFYSYLDEEFNLEYNLLPNRSNFTSKENLQDNGEDLFSLFNENVDESSRLIPELTKTDYLLLIKGDEFYHFSHKISEALKTVPEIVAIQEVVPEKLNSRSNLIF
jgi:hypothetical protein